MTSEEIEVAVTSYIRDLNANYAILIEGAWGTGKTYLYENYLVDAIDSIEAGKNERKHQVYISLYGISNIDSLSKQLIASFLYVKNRNKYIKKGIKLFSGVVGIVSSAFSLSIGPISTDFSKVIKKLQKPKFVKNLVICFDDLERCTIPINELFGFVNNLIEHCNCKVIILADEKNIGKIYANTNIEGKYLTVLSGNRKVVEDIEEDNRRIKKHELGKNTNNEITVEEVKKLNEILYSENYLYKDIKEKVIGKTFSYYPVLVDVIEDLICGNEKRKGIIQEKHYKEYLLNHKNDIVSAFNETDNRNVRIIRSWIISFKKIYDETTKYFPKEKYYEDILSDFLRYSIWVIGASKKNKKIEQSSNYGNQDMVYFEGHEYNHIFRYSFIEAWINRDVWYDKELSRACRSIIVRREQEDVDNPPQIHSEGKSLLQLRDWFLLDDVEIRKTIDSLELEIEENKYAYYDYSNILSLLLFLQEKGLYDGNINNIKDTMINLINNDMEIQEENEFPKTFSSEEIRDKYNKLYKPISRERKLRNQVLSKEIHAEENIYYNGDVFLEHCRRKANYYCSQRTFVNYLDFDKLYNLINNSNNQGLYNIGRAFKAVYYMGNLNEFYTADIEGLKKFRTDIMDGLTIKRNGITRQIALDSLAELIKQELILLGVDEDQL